MKSHTFKHEMTTTSNVFGRTKGVEVVFQGDQPKTDGKTIYLPAIPDNIELTQEQIRLMRGFVDHEAGHLRHSDMPHVLEKYKKWSENNKEGLRVIHNSLEDVWMERKVEEEYLGSKKNLATVTDAVAQREAETIEQDQEYFSQINADTVGLGIRNTGRAHHASEYAENNLLQMPENVQEWSKKWIEEVGNCENSQDITRLAKAIYKLLKEDPELESSPQDFDPQSGDDVSDDDEGEPTQEQQSKYGASRDGAESGEEEAEGPGKGEGPVSVEDIIENGIPGGKGVPDGDYKGSYRVWSTKYDKVVDLSNPGSYNGFTSGTRSRYNQEYSNASSRISSSVSVMRAKLRRALIAKQNRDYDFGKEMGRLDTKRLVSGSMGNRFVYKTRKDREEVDTAVQILVDMSGSMSGSPIEAARECAIALAECVEGAGISYQISGFTTHQDGYHERNQAYRDGGNYHRYDAQIIFNMKRFGDSLRESKAPIAAMTEQSMSQNADRDAIVWAHNELKRRPESRKILITLSDGSPANISNAGVGELIRHCKIAVDDMRKDKIECVGIGIQDESVTRIYPDAIVVNNVQELSGKYFKKFTDLLLKGAK